MCYQELRKDCNYIETLTEEIVISKLNLILVDQILSTNEEYCRDVGLVTVDSYHIHNDLLPSCLSTVLPKKNTSMNRTLYAMVNGIITFNILSNKPTKEWITLKYEHYGHLWFLRYAC